MSGEGTIAVEHRRFGRLEVSERDVLQFDALPGFPSARRFALLAHVCERALDTPYETLLAERVLKPIGAENGAFGWPAGPDRPGGIWGHSVEGETVAPFRNDVRLGAFLAPAGDLGLTLPGFARLAHQQVAGPRGDSPVVPATNTPSTFDRTSQSTCC